MASQTLSTGAMHQTAKNTSLAVALSIESEARIAFSASKIVLMFTVGNGIQLDDGLTEARNESIGLIARVASILRVIAVASLDGKHTDS